MSMLGNSHDPTAFQEPIQDGSDQTFMADVIEASKTTPVVVDFWAPWCGPCKQLTPALERAVRGAKGKVRLVKINIDENPAIAGQLGVRSIPAVYAFDKGRPIDGFMGAVPESQIKMFIDRLAGAGGMDGAVTELLAQAQESLDIGDLGGAAQGFASVLQVEPENTKAIAGLARCYLASGEPEEARATLDMAPDDKKNDSDIAGVRAALELASDAGDAGDPRALLAKVQADPKDFAARYDLARALAARGDLGGAIDHLLGIIERDRAWNDEAARKHLIKIFDAAGAGSELAKQGRRRLSAILFS
ncbi:MAG: tetratricopeptide repeat protein [Alphaproteobacteria bacterium]|nr:tetratricopeptide repeat protein [Alphaproteobacteria bacterium]